jgi:hypothetical protein
MTPEMADSLSARMLLRKPTVPQGQGIMGRSIIINDHSITSGKISIIHRITNMSQPDVGDICQLNQEYILCGKCKKNTKSALTVDVYFT